MYSPVHLTWWVFGTEIHTYATQSIDFEYSLSSIFRIRKSGLNTARRQATIPLLSV